MGDGIKLDPKALEMAAKAIFESWHLPGSGRVIFRRKPTSWGHATPSARDSFRSDALAAVTAYLENAKPEPVDVKDNG